MSTGPVYTFSKSKQYTIQIVLLKQVWSDLQSPRRAVCWAAAPSPLSRSWRLLLCIQPVPAGQTHTHTSLTELDKRGRTQPGLSRYWWITCLCWQRNDMYDKYNASFCYSSRHFQKVSYWAGKTWRVQVHCIFVTLPRWNTLNICHQLWCFWRTFSLQMQLSLFFLCANHLFIHIQNSNLL